jgi:hypothetical protein
LLRLRRRNRLGYGNRRELSRTHRRPRQRRTGPLKRPVVAVDGHTEGAARAARRLRTLRGRGRRGSSVARRFFAGSHSTTRRSPQRSDATSRKGVRLTVNATPPTEGCYWFSTPCPAKSAFEPPKPNTTSLLSPRSLVRGRHLPLTAVIPISRAERVFDSGWAAHDKVRDPQVAATRGDGVRPTLSTPASSARGRGGGGPMARLWVGPCRRVSGTSRGRSW